ncbi:MAG: FlgD immunoglobulin-like domain containing protein, partial [Rariglobus sp.]
MNGSMCLRIGRFLAALLVSASLFPAAHAETVFNFTLARDARTSAGVYNATGKLVRTLWADAHFANAGTYGAAWDNLDDSGAAAPPGTYTVKVMAHNANYVWEGVLGNTSDNFS